MWDTDTHAAPLNGSPEHDHPARSFDTVVRMLRYGGIAAAMAIAAMVTTGYAYAGAETSSTGSSETSPTSQTSEASGNSSNSEDDTNTDDDVSDGEDASVPATELGDVEDDEDIEDADVEVGLDEDATSDEESSDRDRAAAVEEVATDDSGETDESEHVSADIPGPARDEEPGESDGTVPSSSVEKSVPAATSGRLPVRPVTESFDSTEMAQPDTLPLSPITTTSAGTPAGSPVHEPVQTLYSWSLLGWVRRNFFNQAPVLNYDPSANVQGPLGVITGSFGAVDPEGDALTYAVISRPKHGTVVIDEATGVFTYTPDLEYAMAGGVDTFRVRVTDGKLNLLHFLRPDFGMPRISVSLEVQSIQPSADRFIVPLPAEVTQPQNPAYTADGAALIFRATPVGATRTEIYRVATDGSGLQCLTCGLAPELTDNLSKPFVFDDGNRILLSAGTQSDTGGETADHYILECAGGVSTCGAGSQLLEITVPTDVPANVVVLQKQRELRVAPDGVHVGFTQLLASGTATQLVSSIGRLERTETGYDVVDARVVYVGGELKNFTSDGKGVMITDFSGKYEAGNADNVMVNLSDGTVTRLTANLDYDESVDMSPNGQWLALGSSRTLDYLTPMSQIKRPTFVPAYVVFPTFQAKKGSLNQAWVVSVDDELSGENGIFLGDPSGGYNSVPVANWSPDGSAIAFWERSKTDPSDTRLVVATLNNIDGGIRQSDVSTPDTSGWAQPLSSVTVKATPTEPSRAGKVSGSAMVTTSKTGNLTTTTVTYVDFEDEHGFILNGTETTVTNPTLTNITYSADISVTGSDGNERGYLLADGVKIVNQLSLTGTIESSLDGNLLVMGSAAP